MGVRAFWRSPTRYKRLTISTLWPHPTTTRPPQDRADSLIATLPNHNHLPPTNIIDMQFLTLVAAALSTVATVAVAAPGNSGDSGAQNVRVGFSLSLQPNTPLSSLSCSATFAKKFPSEPPFLSGLPDGLLIFLPPPTDFHTLSDLPTAPFYGEVPGAGTSHPPHTLIHYVGWTKLTRRFVLPAQSTARPSAPRAGSCRTATRTRST